LIAYSFYYLINIRDFIKQKNLLKKGGLIVSPITFISNELLADTKEMAELYDLFFSE